MNTKTRFSILLISDDRLSREKLHILNRTIYELKQEFQVEIFREDEPPTEAKILEKIQKEKFDLVLAPLPYYYAWHRIEGFWGTNRTSGPTFAGYFCETLALQKLPESPQQIRRILLDFCNLTIPEQMILIRSLISDKLRAGITPFLSAQSPIYFENWHTNQGLGNRFDQILNLPEIAKTEWIKRASSIQIILSALWGLVYVGRLGKSEWVPTSDDAPPKAYFQIGIDPTCLVMRLWFAPLPKLFAQNWVKLFTAGGDSPSQPGSLLLRYADFIRVHNLGESSNVEIVVGLFPSQPSEKAPDSLHTLWLEPLSESLVSEPPQAKLSSDQPNIRMLPTFSKNTPQLRLIETEKLSQKKDAAITQAVNNITHLREIVQAREDKIKELKQGGVGSAPPIEPPDAEALLEGFQERYFDAKHQIRQFEVEIHEIEKNGGTQQEIHTLRLKMEALQNREVAWIKKLMATLELFKNSKK